MKTTLLIFLGVLLLCGISSAAPVCTPAPIHPDMTITAATNFPTGTSDTFTVKIHGAGCVAANTTGPTKVCVYQEGYSETLLATCGSFTLINPNPTAVQAEFEVTLTFATKILKKTPSTSYATAYLFPGNDVFASSVTQRGAPIWYF